MSAMHKVSWKGRLRKAASITAFCVREQRNVRILLRALLPEQDLVCSACGEMFATLKEKEILSNRSDEASFDLRL